MSRVARDNHRGAWLGRFPYTEFGVLADEFFRFHIGFSRRARAVAVSIAIRAGSG